MITDFSNGENAVTASFDSITINENTVAETRISQVDSTTSLQIDEDGDGNVDQTLPPVSYLVNYTIIARAGDGGTITPKDTLVILRGDSVTFSIVPDSGYVIKDVLVDSVSVGQVSSYSFNGVYKNHTIYAEFGLSTGIETGGNIPFVYFLKQNYPNPFNPSTEITFGIPRSCLVTITVYNTLGQKVATLINNKKMNAGTYTVMFDASNLSSGIYYYKIQAGKFISVKKMLVIR